jgi:hypothetical protein
MADGFWRVDIARCFGRETETIHLNFQVGPKAYQEERVYTGKVQMDGQTPLNTSLFASGFYNVHVINNSDSQNFKLIISR